MLFICFFFFKQKTAYEMRISDWSSDVCSSDLFANASLFHVPGSELLRVLKQLQAALKPSGVLFSSNPRGKNQEGWSGDRYSVNHDLAAWSRVVTEAGFTEIEHYYRPEGLPREQQPWLASVLIGNAHV